MLEFLNAKVEKTQSIQQALHLLIFPPHCAHFITLHVYYKEEIKWFFSCNLE